jgi:hypothetical protein
VYFQTDFLDVRVAVCINVQFCRKKQELPDKCSKRAGTLSSLDNLLHPANLAGFQAHFNPVGVMRCVRQNIFDDAACPSPTALVLFRDDINLQPGSYILPVLTVHGSTPLDR